MKYLSPEGWRELHLSLNLFLLKFELKFIENIVTAAPQQNKNVYAKLTELKLLH